MLRFKTLALAALPLGAAAMVVPQGALIAQAAGSPLAQVQSHLKNVTTMTANFSQTDRKGRTMGGNLVLKRPGKVRFQYAKGVPLLIVGDGKSLTMIDYEVKQVQRWPIGNSPLSVLLNPTQDMSRIAKVVRNDGQTLLVQARDPRRPEFGTITLGFAKIASAPNGLMLQGWTMIDAQNNRTTVKLSNQRFNVAVADTAFRWTDPRKAGPRG
ncbi:MAG TPA: outer membrane lipoprotein carrier protein LolA [Allosphingosinicella sp.]|jgi:outer membrane lipoprotein-sorting protein